MPTWIGPTEGCTVQAGAQSRREYAEAVCMTGLTFFLWNGGVEGTDCAPELDIDNIWVVPINK